MRVWFLLQLITAGTPSSRDASTGQGKLGTLRFQVDGKEVEVSDDGASLLEILRDKLGIRSPKDGCSPQGQCGCCTVLVDGQPRVSCVTAGRRVHGRSVTTLDGLEPSVRDEWAQAFTRSGASQCGFCTPGLIVRLAAQLERRGELDDEAISNALAAHLCRCTGWRPIFDAAHFVSDTARTSDASRARASGASRARASDASRTRTSDASRESSSEPDAKKRSARVGSRTSDQFHAAEQRALIEGGSHQSVGKLVALGLGGFADDYYPENALVAVPHAKGGWAVGETLHEARLRSRKVQGRNSSAPLRYPVDVPPGAWDLRLQTTFVEPAYLELDASWCIPGGEPRTPLANGGAFGAKLDSAAVVAARDLADEHGRAVRVVLSREDCVRLGPKRPPVAIGVNEDGSGRARIGRTAGSASIAAAIEGLIAAAPGVEVEEVRVAGPPTSSTLRATGWAE
ncbi:MAG TPA: 2Fe-2S iron-sulfur cluster-binding protein, partial [Acidimicrobiales bacterium]|nr:2Fe-2S iron-sulfur cluster-binding protein [Acidimicrobiales bacterium]